MTQSQRKDAQPAGGRRKDCVACACLRWLYEVTPYTGTGTVVVVCTQRDRGSKAQLPVLYRYVNVRWLDAQTTPCVL